MPDPVEGFAYITKYNTDFFAFSDCYFISDFDQVCIRLQGLIRSSISDSFAFNVAVPFNYQTVT